MRLSVLVLAAISAFAGPWAQAQSTPAPLFGDNPDAKAVLDCHVDYAQRFANAIVKVDATPTEIATAAYAHCISQFNYFVLRVETPKSTEDPSILMSRSEYRADQASKMRDYAFALTIDTYLKGRTMFSDGQL